MGIKIYDLYPNSDAPFLKETTTWEMSNIRGGFGRRRRRRNRNPSTTNSSDLSALLEDINNNVDKWRAEIDTALDDLSQEISF
jgi:hypothetical protein